MKITRIVLALAAALVVPAFSAAPAHAAPDYVRVDLVELTCYDQSEGDHDEAYLKWYDAKIWPGNGISYQTMGAGYVRSLADAQSIVITRDMTGVDDITLWDDDSTSSDDRIARFYVGGDEVGLGDRYSIYHDANAHYVLRYRVVDI